MKADLVRKTWEIFNLTTKNVILMKLTAITYLYKIYHLVQKVGRKLKGVRRRIRKTS